MAVYSKLYLLLIYGTFMNIDLVILNMFNNYFIKFL